ncbi:MAG: calcium-binding protein, partial [Hydrogenophaga sp.]|nr:calcium-binding protein [Hydrogenophaga sp.]
YSSSSLKKNVARGGSVNDSIYVGSGVKAELDFDGGGGNDSFLILGGAAGSVIRGGAGNDEFGSGSRSGIVFLGGDGNDKFIGGEANDIVDMGAGINTIFGGGGNDLIRVSGTSDTVDAGDGDDLILATLVGELDLVGGAGNDRLVLGAFDAAIPVFNANQASFTSVTPIQLNDQALVVTTAGNKTRSVVFNDSLDQVQLTDRAATSQLVTAAGASWNRTDLVFDADGVIDVSRATLKAPEAHFSLSAAGIHGTLNTELAELTVVNRGTADLAADRNIVVREADDLSIVSGGRVNGGLYAATGLINLQLLGREAELTLQSGRLATGAGGDITLRADDIDFASGDNRVSGTGALVIRSNNEQQNYRIGGAGQTAFGYDYSAGVNSGYLELGMRDMSALADGFSSITIGHQAPGVIMRIGDLEDTVLGEFSFSSRLDDLSYFLSDRMEIVGDVQASQAINIAARAILVERQNVRNPMGSADAGLRAPSITIRASEQMLVMGWVIADNLIDIAVSGSTGIGGFVTYGDKINSFTADTGSTIQTLASNSLLKLVTSHSIYSATGMFAGVNNGTDARIDVRAGTGLTLMQGGTVATRYARGDISLQAGSFIHMLNSSAVVSGATEDSTLPGGYALTGEGSTLSLVTLGEMTMAGQLTAAGAMTLSASEVQDDFADYFNTLPGRTYTIRDKDGEEVDVALTNRVQIDAVKADLQQGKIGADLRALFTGGELVLSSVPTVQAVGSYVAFADLPEETRNTIALAKGYTVHQNGGFFNPTTGRFFTAVSDGPVIGYDLAAIDWSGLTPPVAGTPFSSLNEAQQVRIAQALGYTRHSGTVYLNRLAAEGQQVVAGFVQGISADYDNQRIDWAAAGLSAPAAGTAFAQLSAAQKLLVADGLGYFYDYGSIAPEAWSATPFDYRTVSRDEWIAASSLNFAMVISAAQWGTVAKPLAGVGYGELTAEQKAVVDRVVQFEPLQADRLTLSGVWSSGDVLSVVIDGQTVSYTVQAGDVVSTGSNA